MPATITITGRLGRDPETKQAGTAEIVEINVASTHRAKIGGNWEDVTTWYRATVWDQSARGALTRFAVKGSYVVVSGSLEPRTHKDKHGVERVSLEIRATSVDVPRVGDAAKPAARAARNDAPRGHTQSIDDDLPF